MLECQGFWNHEFFPVKNAFLSENLWFFVLSLEQTAGGWGNSVLAVNFSLQEKASFSHQLRWGGTKGRPLQRTIPRKMKHTGNKTTQHFVNMNDDILFIYKNLQFLSDIHWFASLGGRQCKKKSENNGCMSFLVLWISNHLVPCLQP